MLRLFVTGTDTGVGKTRIATALCAAYAAHGKRVAAMKPVASGCRRTDVGLRNEDAEALLAAMTVPAGVWRCEPVFIRTGDRSAHRRDGSRMLH